LITALDGAAARWYHEQDVPHPKLEVCVKNFFYLCAALLCLSLAFHFGYATARAQAPGNPVAAALNPGIIVTANGDVYADPNLITPSNATGWQHVANVFSGGPTPAMRESWGQLKSSYAPKPTLAPGTPTYR
jgi:hypothetical protein